jgi:hypothetical protein
VVEGNAKIKNSKKYNPPNKFEGLTTTPILLRRGFGGQAGGGINIAPATGAGANQVSGF